MSNQSGLLFFHFGEQRSKRVVEVFHNFDIGQMSRFVNQSLAVEQLNSDFRLLLIRQNLSSNRTFRMSATNSIRVHLKHHFSVKVEKSTGKRV
jgi:hypothetical protein